MKQHNYDVAITSNVIVCGQHVYDYRTKPKWVHSYLPLYDVLVVFGAVSESPHSGGHVLVYVRVASPLAQA